MDYLGQLIPAPENQGLSVGDSQNIRRLLSRVQDLDPDQTIEVFVASKNELKVEATKSAVEAWSQELFPNSNWKIVVKAYECPSEIDEQPHGLELTITGAMNRLKNFPVQSSQRGLSVFVSLENGLMIENVPHLKNKQIFELENPLTVWVDRCVVAVKIECMGVCCTFHVLSEGVTTPLNEVNLSRDSNWSQTAGSFIAKKYGWNAKDWHGGITGKGRQLIMNEAVKTAFGLPYRIPIPQQTAQHKPDVFHKYINESIDFFSSDDIERMLHIEKRQKIQQLNETELTDIEMWRGIYGLIPQSDKPGADGKSPQNSSGIILTEDIMVCYFDLVDDQDILYVCLSWAKNDGGSKERGWVLPGKRDRAYDRKGDISIKDACFSLVEKEIGVDRSEIAYYTLLGFLDDRMRDERMKTSGFIGLVLLDKKPPLDPAKNIAIPLNALIQLVKREIVIPHYPQSAEKFGLARNHDSLLLNIFETTKFYRVMEQIQTVQAKWRQLLQTNPNAERPPFPEFDPGYDCAICADLLVSTKVICTNGHCICGICLRMIGNVCPMCRQNIMSNPISNLILEGIIQNQYPKRYNERYTEFMGTQPHTWKDDPAFNGKWIQYR